VSAALGPWETLDFYSTGEVLRNRIPIEISKSEVQHPNPALINEIKELKEQR